MWRDRSIFLKFLAVLIPVFVAVTGVGLHVLSEFRLRSDRDQLAVRIGTQVARVAGLVPEEDARRDIGAVQPLLSLLLADRAIVCAELREKGIPDLRSSSPVGLGCAPFQTEQALTVAVPGSDDTELLVRFSVEELAEARRQSREFALAVTIAALLAAILAGAAGFRYVVSRPLERLLSAIRATSVSRMFVSADQRSNDEIGLVIKAFNEMQETLRQESKRSIQSNIELTRREEQLRLQNLWFDAALNNMAHGLSMFNGDRQLLVCNQRYAKLLDLPSALTVPGTPIEDIIRHCASRGLALDDGWIAPDPAAPAASARNEVHELPDGRILAITHQPLATGGWVMTHEDITERRRTEARIAYLARHDPLTSLPNRNALRDHLDACLAKGASVAVHCLDLDRFKNVNDTLGHPVGDLLLTMVGERLRGCIDQDDFIARLGGDEFAVIQTIFGERTEASNLAARIVDALSAPYELEGCRVITGTSIGIAVSPRDGADADILIKHADLALYQSKHDGRGAYRFFEPTMNVRIQARHRLEQGLCEALGNGELRLLYQPLVNLKSNAISGFESLLRWQHPHWGTIAPGDFIPLAEETGLILPIGEWVLRQACAEASTWPEHFNVAVNISPLAFKSGSLVQAVVGALAASALAPNRLELEITESVILTDTEATLSIMHELQALGVRFVLDDFGTGYSSLGYLRRFPFAKIKIDRVFVADLSRGGKDARAILRAVSSLGNALGMTITAEGVESEEQLETVRAEGCTEMQGFLFSAARSPEEIRHHFFPSQRACARVA